MTIKMIEDRLKKYHHRTKQDEENAIREIAQEIALCGLARADFFKKASFIGGSCLRMVHGLKRFSEDLDFWTLHPEPDFAWQPYLKVVKEEFQAYAFDMTIEDREKADTKMRRAFLKKNSIEKVLILTHSRTFEADKKLQIKFEVDTHPPLGAHFESKNMEYPYAFPITTLDRPSLFASKVAALFDRAKEKGRYWYDFAWYVFEQWPLNLHLLRSCLSQPEEITILWLQQELAKIIESIDWGILQKDVRPFISQEDQETVNSWNKQFFLGYVEALDYLNPKPISLSALIADGRGKALIEKVKEALSAGASVNDDLRNGHRPLQLALTHGQRAVAQLLIEHGADVNHRDRSGQTPLQAAVNHKQFEIAKMLIHKGAVFNPHAPNRGFIHEKLHEFQNFLQEEELLMGEKIVNQFDKNEWEW